MILGAIFPLDFLGVWFITLCYILCPKSIIERKNEYLKFFLIFLSVYFFIFLILHYLLGNSHDYNIPGQSPMPLLYALFILGFCPALLVANLVYPFKTVKRSQHLTFFMFLFSLCSWGILIGMTLLVAMSGM